MPELCVQARERLTEVDAGAALVTWLRAVIAYAAANRGLGAALIMNDAELRSSCHSMIRASGEKLLARAQAERTVRPEIGIADLLELMNALSVVAERETAAAARAERLLTISINGIWASE